MCIHIKDICLTCLLWMNRLWPLAKQQLKKIQHTLFVLCWVLSFFSLFLMYIYTFFVYLIKLSSNTTKMGQFSNWFACRKLFPQNIYKQIYWTAGVPPLLLSIVVCLLVNCVRWYDTGKRAYEFTFNYTHMYIYVIPILNEYNE